MAIRPKIQYGPQVEAGDPGYPYGKARNNSVPGDGSGTPYEEDLVNDIFGMQQSLLVEAGVTPSGVPDKVGASDYLDAILQLIENGLIALTGRESVWTAQNFFTSTIQFLGLVKLNAATLEAAQEINYTAPKLRRVLIPMTSFVPYKSSGSQWKLVTLNSPAQAQLWQITGGVTDDDLQGSVRLPAGCTVTEVRTFVGAGPPGTMRLTATRARHDTATPSALSTITAIGAVDTRVDSLGILSTGPASVAFAESDLLSVRITAVSTGNPSYMSWCEVLYTESRATGSQ
jgi:hypothetical protein